MATKTKSKTSSTATETPVTSTATADLKELIELSRSFTLEIENIMTSTISTGKKASALGTATKYFVQYIDDIEQRNA
tara:strand:+ start:52 stop:282 length:231 start_codon:yes stop_codon:yes gene_type:complete